jgi:MFS family permease
MARLVQGASAALVSPQVLATIHTLFPDTKARAKAFSVVGSRSALAAASAMS